MWRDVLVRSVLPAVARAKQGSSLCGEMSWFRSALPEVGRAKQGSSLGGEMSGLELHYWIYM